MCNDIDVICPDITYNQTYLPPLDIPLTYGMSAAGYCKLVGSKMNAKIEYFDGLNWIVDIETSVNYTVEVNRVGVYFAIGAGLLLLNLMLSSASSKITKGN